MPRQNQIVALLKAHEGELRARGVQALFLFGSVGRGEERSGSDVDLFFDHRSGARARGRRHPGAAPRDRPGRGRRDDAEEPASAPARADNGFRGQSVLMRQSDPGPWLHDILEAILGVRATRSAT